MYFLKYKLNGWAEDTGEYTHEGLIYGANLTDAVDNLENWYGDEIGELHIEYIGEKGEPYVFDTQYKINGG